jgi:AbrB family looped-hinge helix DNA binding protein
MATEIRERMVVKSDGRITIPLNLRKALEIKEGSFLEAELYKGNLLISVLVK